MCASTDARAFSVPTNTIPCFAKYILPLFKGHPNVDFAVSHINDAKDAATIPTPAEVTQAENNAASKAAEPMP